MHARELSAVRQDAEDEAGHVVAHAQRLAGEIGREAALDQDLHDAGAEIDARHVAPSNTTPNAPASTAIAVPAGSASGSAIVYERGGGEGASTIDAAGG